MTSVTLIPESLWPGSSPSQSDLSQYTYFFVKSLCVCACFCFVLFYPEQGSPESVHWDAEVWSKPLSFMFSKNRERECRWFLNYPGALPLAFRSVSCGTMFVSLPPSSPDVLVLLFRLPSSFSLMDLSLCLFLSSLFLSLLLFLSLTFCVCLSHIYIHFGIMDEFNNSIHYISSYNIIYAHIHTYINICIVLPTCLGYWHKYLHCQDFPSPKQGNKEAYSLFFVI